MDYEDFIKSKVVVSIPSGFAVGIDDINPMLSDWQRVVSRWACFRGRAALFEACGLGKTFQQIEWARMVCRHTGGDVLILAPLAVTAQTTAEGLKIGVNINPCRSQTDVRDGINIANYEMLDHFDASSFAGVVLDECFPPDQPIDVFNIDNSLESRHISTIRNGDRILNANGVDYVRETYKRRIERAVCVGVNGRGITSSENHPYFTMYGWKCARDLQPGDYIMETATAVRLVRGDFPTEICGVKNEQILRDILLSEMANEHAGTSGEGSQPGSCGEERGEKERMAQERESVCECRVGKDSEFESNEQPGNKEESFAYIAEDGAQTFRAWGEWLRFDGPAEDFAGCTWKRMDSGIFFVTGPTNSGLSNRLQVRLSESRNDDKHRGGRTVSLQQERGGCEKGCESGFARVESVEILEQGHPELEKYRDADGHVYFYDIKAERHPSFSVNGLLVHNSSILKSFMGKTKQRLMSAFANTEYRLCCTATPSPNDHMELLNHSDFLGIMPANEALSRWFINDTMNFGTYRLKGHAAKDFWRWVSTWAVCLNTPSDIGYSDDGYILPRLNTVEHVVNLPKHDFSNGMLFRDDRPISATDLYRELRATAPQRCAVAAELANSNDEAWVVWCNTNDEAQRLEKAIPGSANVHGSMKNRDKEKSLIDFINGRVRVLITKPSMCGFGLNLQHCHNMAFVGLSFSFEQRYQAVRRCWRFGQRHEVNDHVILSPAEKHVFRIVLKKEEKHGEMSKNMVADMKNYLDLDCGKLSLVSDYDRNEYTGRNWRLIVGDSCKEIKTIESDSVGLSIFSPPFSNLYIYSDSVRDMGNCKNDSEFFEHFAHLVPELYRITMPGRLCVIHCKDLVDYKNRDGMSGLRDFPGAIVRLFEASGWKYHSRVTIWKDPVIEMQRTKAQGLLHAQAKRDSTMLRQGLPDYLIVMRKWPEDGSTMGPEPVSRPEGFGGYVGIDSPEPKQAGEGDRYSIHVWQRYASPVWFDIRQTNVLNCRIARDSEDEKHICPLQLDVINRCIHLWSNPGDIVFSPFAGVCSELYGAVETGRKGLGIELKPVYAEQGAKILGELESAPEQIKLFA